MTKKRRRITIIGVGLMGGALGLAIRRKKGPWHVVGVGRKRTNLKWAKGRGCLDSFTTDMIEGVQKADIVVLAVPVDKIVPLARRIRPHLNSNTLVMDVGSVKGPIVHDLQKIYGSRHGPYFVGVHPMAGSEKTGVKNVREDFYKNSACFITPGPHALSPIVHRAEQFWRQWGTKIIRIKPEAHDRCVAAISHLPHLLADALVLSVAHQGLPLALVRRAIGGSFRDMTRVAAADPHQWTSIFKMNHKALTESFHIFQAVLKRLHHSPHPTGSLNRARRLRQLYIPS